jgi:integrase
MYWAKRTNRAGEFYYSFIYFDLKPRKNVRLRREEVPIGIDSDAQADAFCRTREAEHEAVKLRIQRKLDWQRKFYDFDKLLDLFEADSKVRAPNSWRQSVYNLEHYAFDFFLTTKQCNNLNNWSLHFDEFRDWLLAVKTSRQTKGGGLAYSSRNHVIRALNTFLAVMARKGHMEPAPKCRCFDSSLMNKRSIDHVLSDEEVHFVYKRLSELDPSLVAADFFRVSVGTGVRLSEGLAFSVADVFEGEPVDRTFREAMKKNGFSCLGFVSINSQLRDSAGSRGPEGQVARKPLKGRRRIDEESGRTIPVLDKEVYNSIARLFNKQNERFINAECGQNASDYLLFDGLNKNIYSSLLRKAYEGSIYRHKSPHCARHTFATRFAGLTCGDMYLCQAVLGHRDIDTTRDYVHIFAALNKAARAKEQKRGGMRLID